MEKLRGFGFKKILLLLLFFALTLSFSFKFQAIESIISNFDELPETTGNVASDSSEGLGKVDFGKRNDGNYDLIFTIGDNIYRMNNVELPSEDGYLTPDKPGFYYTKNDSRFIHWKFDSDNTTTNVNMSHSVAAIKNDATPFQRSVTWNLTSGEYVVLDKIVTFSKIIKGSTGVYFADIIFQIPIDDVLTISFNATVEKHYLWGLKNVSEVKNFNLVKGAESYVNKLPWWTLLLSTTLFAIGEINDGKNAFTTMKVEDIERRYLNQYDEAYKANHVKDINLKYKQSYTVDEVWRSDASIYRFYLDQYNDFGLTGVSIADDEKGLVITEMTYEYNGIKYRAYEDDFLIYTVGVSEQPPLKPVGDFFKSVTDWFKNENNRKKLLGWLIAIAVAVGLGYLAVKLVPVYLNRPRFARKKPARKRKKK